MNTVIKTKNELIAARLKSAYELILEKGYTENCSDGKYLNSAYCFGVLQSATQGIAESLKIKLPELPHVKTDKFLGVS